MTNPAARSRVRLLVVDEAIAPGGVERVLVALMPELARLCERVVWLLPQHRIKVFRDAMPSGAAVCFEEFHWPVWSLGKARSALGRRIAAYIRRKNPNCALQLDKWLKNDRLNEAIKTHRITHLLFPALFLQSLPDVSLPCWAVVHDVNYHPKWKNECRANLARWGNEATGIVTNSKFTRDEVVRLHPEFQDRITAIPNALDWKPLDRGAMEILRVGADPAPSLYYPASFNPHKGHAILLEALRQLHDAGVNLRLVLTGGGTTDLHSSAPLEIPKLEAARRVLQTAPNAFRRKIEVRGTVSNDEVDACYANASLVVLPSDYEGFGLPLVEAVGRGRKALCADISAFREQVQIYGFDQAVTFVPEQSAAAWASAIQTALKKPFSSPYSEDDLRSQFARWTWKDAAESYVRALSR